MKSWSIFFFHFDRDDFFISVGHTHHIACTKAHSKQCRVQCCAAQRGFLKMIHDIITSNTAQVTTLFGLIIAATSSATHRKR